jgi:hypothetical protein
MATSRPSQQDVTSLLQAWRGGNNEALARPTPLVYDELHRLANRYMRREHAGHSLQPPRSSTRRTSGWSIPSVSGGRAEALHVLTDTVGRDWRAAKAWSTRELK